MSEQIRLILALVERMKLEREQHVPQDVPQVSRDARGHLILSTITGAVCQFGIQWLMRGTIPDLLVTATTVCTSIIVSAVSKPVTALIDDRLPGWVQFVIGFSIGFLGSSVWRLVPEVLR